MARKAFHSDLNRAGDRSGEVVAFPAFQSVISGANAWTAGDAAAALAVYLGVLRLPRESIPQLQPMAINLMLLLRNL